MSDELKSSRRAVSGAFSSVFGRSYQRPHISDGLRELLSETPLDDHEAVRAIFQIRDAANEQLSKTLRSPKSKLNKYFGDTAFLRLITEQFLCHAIEDEGIDLRDVGPQIVKSLRTYYKTGNREDVWDVYETVVSKQPISTETVSLRVNRFDTSILASIPADRESEIPVSTSSFPLVPIIEQTIAEPNLCIGLSDAYASLIGEFVQENSVDKLCFVEKSVGPIGALGLMSTLVEKTGIPACVYRERYFADRGKISGSDIIPNSRLLLIYDLIVSGQGLRGVARNLKDHFEAEAVGAVVLFNFSDRRHIDSAPPLETKSIAMYSEYRSDVSKFLKSDVESVGNIEKYEPGGAAMSRRRRSERVLAAPGQTLRGAKMDDEKSVVLHFGSIDEFENAVRAYYDVEELNGFEIDTADGRTLIVPKASLPSLRRLGVGFQSTA